MPEFTVTALCGQIISAKNEEEAESVFYKAVESGEVQILDKTIKVIKH